MLGFILFAQQNSGGAEIVAGLVMLLFVLFIMALSIGMFALWIWMLIDCATNEREDQMVMWIVLIVVLQGIGALLYYFVRRPQRRREIGK